VTNYKGKICDVSHQVCYLYMYRGVSTRNNVDQKIALVCDLVECKLNCMFLLANLLAQIDYDFYVMERLLVSFNCGLF